MMASSLGLLLGSGLAGFAALFTLRKVGKIAAPALRHGHRACNFADAGAELCGEYAAISSRKKREALAGARASRRTGRCRVFAPTVVRFTVRSRRAVRDRDRRVRLLR